MPAMPDRWRWIYEVYRRNWAGVLAALVLTALAAAVEIASMAMYYPVLAIFTGASVTGRVGARLVGLVSGIIGARPGLASILALLVFLMVLRAGLLYLSRIVSNHYELEFQLALKREFLRRFAEASWEFIIRSKSGSILNIFGSHTSEASRGLFCLVEFLMDVVSCAAYLGFAVYVSPTLAVFIVAAGLVVGPVVRSIYGRIRALVQQRIAVQNELANKFLDYLRGIKTFKSMSLERFYLREIDADLRAFNANQRRSQRVQATLTAIGQPLFGVIGAAFLLVAYYRFAVGMETVVIFFALLTRTYTQLNGLQVNFGRLIAHLPAIRACHDFEVEAAAAGEMAGGSPLAGRISVIELDRVGFAYPDGTRVFESVSLALGVDRGLFAIAGPSGTGKTTLLDLLSALVRPTSGAIRINGTDVRALDLRALRARFGFVPQSPVLFNRSVKENISLREEAETDLEGVEAAARMADAHEFIARLARGYDTVMGEEGASLSLGQIQRVSIARALYQRPEILFFDEPTSALDPRAAAEVMRVIERIAETYPVFLVSHSEDTRRNAQTLLVLDGGTVRVVEPAQATSVR